MFCDRKITGSGSRKGSISNYSTDLDSSFQNLPAKGQKKLKTQLCKTFSIIGNCPYGAKCRFAHGKQELIVLPQMVNKKHRDCLAFWQKGVCPYGSRCQFGHQKLSWQTKACLLGLQAVIKCQNNSQIVKWLS